MTSEQLGQAWSGPLNGAAPANPGDCHVLTPVTATSPQDVSLMVEGDKFVRYDIGIADQAAPGGGKVGMTVDQIRSLYAGRIREQPAKYVPGGVDLRVSADDDSGSALVFETDADGKVTPLARRPVAGGGLRRRLLLTGDPVAPACLARAGRAPAARLRG